MTQRTRDEINVTDISFDPPTPSAGEEFRIIVRLDRPVEGNPLALGWEKQRIKFIASGGYFPELRPTGAEYFSVNPEPITVAVGKDSGQTRATVREDALDSDGKPVPFPDNLVFTYFVATGKEDADSYCLRIVKIRPA